ncbi:MAG: S8/S53 family peptidase, partial [Candidatus Eremiobacteraeota bacterium]|nr:S8/S53 family peptidase [Candidatus Eremiobacteraeota bacterium]
MKLFIAAAAAVLASVLTAAPAAARSIQPIGLGGRSLALPALRGATVGHVSPSARIDVYVRLPGRRDAELDGFVDAVTAPESPWFGRYLTPEQFGSYFGADPFRYAAAVRALQQHGFVIDELPPNRTDIVAHASAENVEAFFATPLDLRVDRGREYYTNRYLPVVPPALAGAVVSGLDDYVQFHPMLRRDPNTVIGGRFSWGPDDVAAAYELTPLYKEGLDGKGVTIANATCGAAVPSDLALFQKTFALPAAPLVSTAEPTGSHLTTACGRTSYGNGESSLDSDWATAIAREATFHQVVAAGPSNHDFDTVYSYIVNTLGHSVHVVTTSWGTCERDMKGTASLTIDEKLLAQAKAEGQHWFSASGDAGTDDCQDGGTAVSVDFPGSSPYVMSVGGTNVKGRIVRGNVTEWLDETVWQASNSDGATGGGASILYAKPRYQRGVTPNDGVRDVPDVALIADNVNDGLWAAQGGQVAGGWGGTSESSPQWAGLLAIVEQRYHNARIADPHARLYQLASSKAYHLLFHDI